MTLARLGVVIVTFNSADVILDCLESLLASSQVALEIVVVDNASGDGTPALVQGWASGKHDYCAAADIPLPMAACAKPLRLDGGDIAGMPHRLRLIETGINAGFAAGVNRGLADLAVQTEIERFWVLNPDSVVPPNSAAAFAMHPAPPSGFSLIGGRVLYLDQPDIIQIDGGTINRRTGMTKNLGFGGSHRSTPPPTPAQIDFISGASLVVSRQFYERAGPMPEYYFLYYEEVDWALQRGDLPLLYCAGGIVYHRAGTAIGSPTLERPASPFSLYFKHRARVQFMRRHFPRGLVSAYAYSLAKAAQLLLKGYPAEAGTVLRASFGGPPTGEIRARLSAEAAKLAFAPRR